MNSESQPYSTFDALRDADIMPERPAEELQRSPAPATGPMVGMALMASFALPLVCVAALRTRSPLAETAFPSHAPSQTPRSPSGATPRSILWNNDFHLAQQQAAASNKSMMIDFYTDSNPNCLLLDAKVFTEPAVAMEAQNIVPVKINVEGQADLARRYNITQYPTIVWTDAAGNEKFRQVGWTSAFEFYQTMQQYR